MTKADIGLFHYLLSDSDATIGTINETIPYNDSIKLEAFINSAYTKFRVVIPNCIEYKNKNYTITTIGAYSFRKSDITYLYIPRSVVRILDYAIDWVPYLEKVEFERDSQLIEIQRSFLVDSTVTRLEIPAYASSIGTAFLKYNTHIKKIFFFGKNEITCESDLSAYEDLQIYVHSYYKSSKLCSVSVISRDIFPSLAPVTCNYKNEMNNIRLLYLCSFILE